MNKGLSFVLLLFFVLVFLNWVFVSASTLLPSVTFIPTTSNSAIARASDGSGIVGEININLFTASGIGTNYLTQGYGRTPYSYLYINGWHNGVDIAASFGTPVYSPTAGTILATVNQDAYCPHIGFGKYVAVDDPVHHLVLVFSHFGTFDVSPGQTISKGTLLGTIGPTGLETGPHLLLSIFKEQGFNTSPAHGCGPYPQGQDVDPLNYLGSVYN